ncbi:MAG TPA: hypothetical protein VFA22_08525 [Stellaceae bacterium]|nr:hypothetical protein [Stellaceae bacterium]
MRRTTALGLGAMWLLAGCAAASQSSPADPPAAGTTPAAAPVATGPSFLSIIGTPFLIAFKIPVCAATVAVAAPLAGLSEIPTTADTEGSDMRRQLEYGVNSNCGPPWVVSP